MDDSTQRNDDRGLARTLSVTGEEFRRRNPSAVVIDVLYLFTTAFLTALAMHGFWPAVMAAVPLATFLLFAWRASRPFFLANLLTIGIAAAAVETGYVPI